MSQTLLIDVADAARRLAVSRSTVRRLIDRGSLRKVKLGRSLRIPTRDLERLIQGLARESRVKRPRSARRGPGRRT